jgi:hypothetical protein
MDELIEHHEWDKLLSMLEKVADDNEDGVNSSSESWSILLFSFCQAVITGGMTNTATKTKTTTMTFHRQDLPHPHHHLRRYQNLIIIILLEDGT